MIGSKRILALIPARGGSKGIPHKNIIMLGRKPLIDYSISAALHSRYIDDVVVSTDDEMIAEVSRKSGAQVPFIRPDELASDTAATIDVVMHALDFLKSKHEVYDFLVLLQPTQPLRTSEDIDMAIEKYIEEGCQSLVSVSPAETHPILIRSIKDGRLFPLLGRSGTCRRQDFSMYYQINGCIYINRVEELSPSTSFGDNVVPFIMEPSHSVDIDEMKDLHMAEYYLSLKENER